MTSTIQDLDANVLEAFRNAWRPIVKATSGTRTDISVDAVTGAYVRQTGSWLSDGFDCGDEITAGGLLDPGNNGLGIVQWLDALHLQVVRPWANPDALVTAAAGAVVTISMGMPEFIKYDGWKQSPASGRPWIRESYQPGMAAPRSLRSPTALTRQYGVYWLTVFYPSDAGTAGADRLRGKIMAQIYPAAQLFANGQLVRVDSTSKKPVTEEAEWSGLPLSIHHNADALNPA